ncbi:aldehyde reductase [Paragonimus westermani]|uniref:Aldehyde reductase n=1 Tax=Paragonimus westermani TaxID=34504 RepID=A0A5J4P0E4_9TREM|nr:aldehyde reductase [Paragonimus westermani]
MLRDYDVTAGLPFLPMTFIKLSDGYEIPTVGLGTWRCSASTIRQSVSCALETKYRHFDCAYLYGNEKGIGEALEESLKRLSLKRETIFVTSKVNESLWISLYISSHRQLWCTYFRPELVRRCCMQSLANLRLQYIDLYLMHSPMALQAMEKLVDGGLVKSIGLSNFNQRQISHILAHCRIRPVNLQIEIHANFPNTCLVDYAHSVGLTVTAYAPLGSPGGFRGKTNLLTESWVTEIAKRHQKTCAQILLRYCLQRGLIVIPKSSKPHRIKENIQVFDFELSEEEMDQLNTSGLNERQFRFEKLKHHPEYPFHDDI